MRHLQIQPITHIMMTTGEVVIKKEKITGPVVIQAKPDCIVANDGTKCSITEIDDQDNDVDDNLAEHDKDYVAVITPNNGYLLPENIVVTAGDKTLVEGTDYTYDKETGKVVVNSDKVDGKLIIKAVAVPKQFDVDTTGVKKAEVTNKEKATFDQDYTTTIKPNKGYALPDSINVTVGEEVLVEGTDYTYDRTTGEVVIKKEKITAPIVIEAKPDCVVVKDETKCSITEIDDQNNNVDNNLAEYGCDYVAVIEPDYGYLLPENIDVTTGGNTLVEGTDYTYDTETGKVVVNSDKIAGNLTIKAVAVPKQFDVDTTGVKKATVTNKEKATFAQDYTTTIKPNKGYALPDSINVTVGEEVLVEGTDYTYDSTTGEVVIPKESVVDDIKIAADMKVLKNDIVINTENLDTDAKKTVETDDEYKVIVKPTNNKYELPETIEVKVDGKTLEPGKDYTYDKKTGQVVIKKDVINGKVVINAQAIPIHVLTKVPAKAATCTTDGNTEYYTCSKCSDLFADADATKKIDKAATVVKAEGHKWGDWVVDESGKTRSHVCTVCGEKEQEAYDGSKANALALNAGLKVDQVGKKIKLAWGKVDDADGYMLYWTYCGTKFSNRNRKTVKSPSITTYTIKKVNGKKLNLKKNFKLYVVAYKNVDGKKQTIGKTVTAHIVGRKNTDYTNVKEVKVSKKTMTVSVNKTEKIKAKTVLVDKSKKQLTDEHAKEFRYATTDENVATVNAKGVVTGKSKGTCTVYVYARNGYAQAITVTVK
jgi:polyisoprenoid-binding protein YceI